MKEEIKRLKRYRERMKKYKNMSPLEMTARDHKIIGSTPSPEMAKNPDKTDAELMTDEKLLIYLRELKESVAKYSIDKYKNNTCAQSILLITKRSLRFSIKYLKNIGRLPKEFENFNVDSLK